MRRLIGNLRNNQQIEAAVLAGAELPLRIRAEMIDDLPLLDTTELHVRAIVERLGVTQPESAALQKS